MKHPAYAYPNLYSVSGIHPMVFNSGNLLSMKRFLHFIHVNGITGNF